MTREETKRILSENAYLKDRCHQLEASVSDLDARLALSAAHIAKPAGKRGRWHANLMSGGQ